MVSRHNICTVGSLSASQHLLIVSIIAALDLVSKEKLTAVG